MLDKEIRYLKGVGPARAERLGKLGIATVNDMLLHLPRDYLDRRNVTPIASLSPGGSATVVGTVSRSYDLRTRKGGKIFQVVLDDGTGAVTLTFFHARYLRRKLKKGVRLSASGKVESYRGLSMAHPDLYFLDASEDREYESGKLLPVYPLTAGISQGVMRKLVQTALSEAEGQVGEILPPSVLRDAGWQSRFDLLVSVHSPSQPDEGWRARETLALEELYLYQQMLGTVRQKARSLEGIPLRSDPRAVEVFVDSLPFELTGAQRRVIESVIEDVSLDVPMRRLLQGDVGSGKTVVAALACWICLKSGHQAAMLAPTEVLASQHRDSLGSFLEPLGVPCHLLTSSTPGGERKRIQDELYGEKPCLLIGTHAILEESVSVPELGLLVVDEQQKFGVAQRESLLEGRLPRPHMLVMTATPIPRTLSMTFYGDLDLSVIDEMPPGRGSVETRVMGRQSKRRIFRFLEKRLGQGERAYLVYPLKEASEQDDLRDATSAYEVLREGSLGRFGVGLLHGGMPGKSKVEVSEAFAAGDISLLVCTTVVEVGLDVPEATVMVVVNAERFGLSQLHQLRGRIGRGGRDAWCFLVTGSSAEGTAMERLMTLQSTTDGFEIARKDLELRGPGELLGTRQHGVPGFRVADLARDSGLVPRAKALAVEHPRWERLRDEFELRFGPIGPPGI